MIDCRIITTVDFYDVSPTLSNNSFHSSSVRSLAPSISLSQTGLNQAYSSYAKYACSYVVLLESNIRLPSKPNRILIIGIPNSLHGQCFPE